MSNLQRFLLLLAPEKQVEVLALTIESAVRVGCAASPYFTSVDTERPMAVCIADGLRYTLTCLFCGKVNPSAEGVTLLISMQEHLMQTHAMTPNDLRGAYRAFCGTSEEGQFIWSLYSSQQEGTSLPYLRASRYAAGGHAYEGAHPRTFASGDVAMEARTGGAIFLQSDSRSLFPLNLMGEDEIAWYGYPAEGKGRETMVVCPKQAWQRASSSNGDGVHMARGHGGEIAKGWL